MILYGSVDLTGATSFTYSGTVSFSSISTLSRINANNFVFANANFVGTGSWTLDGVFRVSGTTTHSTGSLISNGFRVYLGNVYDATSVSTKTLNLTGTDTLYVGYSFRMNSAGTTTLIKDAAILKMESNIDVTHIIDIPGKTLNGVVVNTLAVSTSAQDLQFLGTNAVLADSPSGIPTTLELILMPAVPVMGMLMWLTLAAMPISKRYISTPIPR